MAYRHMLEALDRSLHDLMQKDSPLGGNVILLGSDFHKVLPVIKAQFTGSNNGCIALNDLLHGSTSTFMGYVKICEHVMAALMSMARNMPNTYYN